jgi:hypothetical protein
MAYEDVRERYQHLERARAWKKTFQEVKDVFEDKKETLEESDIDRAMGEAPKKPNFPNLLFTAAVLKDVLDCLDLTFVGILLTTLLGLFLGVAVFIWCLGKISGGWWRKAMIRLLIWGFIILFFAEIIPYVKIIPVNSIFILMVYFREKKIVRLFNLLLEKMHEAELQERLESRTGISINSRNR